MSRFIQLKQVINQIKEITELDITIRDKMGEVVTSTLDTPSIIKKEFQKNTLNYKELDLTYGNPEVPLIIEIHNDIDTIYVQFDNIKQFEIQVIKLAVMQVENFYHLKAKSYNKQEVISKAIGGEIQREKLYQLANNLGINTSVYRVLYMIECEKKSAPMVVQTIQSLYATGIKDFVIEKCDGIIVFVKEIEITQNEIDIQGVAHTLVDTLSAELFQQIRVSYSNLFKDIMALKEAMEQAKIALNVGKSFYGDRTILDYAKLGIGRLIYQLPKDLSQTYMEEVLLGKGLEQFDEETMTAVYKFFQNNLNISETARQLYLHRNTLVYRLEKIQKKTGLDVRFFDDAMTFKIAMMVSQHIKFLDAK